MTTPQRLRSGQRLRVYVKGIRLRKPVFTSRVKLRENYKQFRAAIFRTFGERDETGAKLVFTSTGSEANALALFGTAFAKERVPKRIISTDSEHPSVENSLKRLENFGFEVVRIPTRGGLLDFEALEKGSNPRSLLQDYACK